jgi:hypothetical protein
MKFDSGFMKKTAYTGPTRTTVKIRPANFSAVPITKFHLNAYRNFGAGTCGILDRQTQYRHHPLLLFASYTEYYVYQ